MLGVGLGADEDYTAFGEPVRDRGRRLDESLTVLTALLTGGPVDFDGDHLHVHSPAALPGPVNGTIPIWVGGMVAQPGALRPRRPLRRNGPRQVGSERGEVLTIDDLRGIRDAGRARRRGFDYVVSGNTASASDVEAVHGWEAAGATWWLESLHPFGARAPPTGCVSDFGAALRGLDLASGHCPKPPARNASSTSTASR